MAKRKAGPRDYAAEAVAKVKSTAKGRAALKRASERFAELAANPPMVSSSQLQDDIAAAFQRGVRRGMVASAPPAAKAKTMLTVFPNPRTIPPEFLSEPMTANEVAMLVEGKKFSAAMKWLRSSGIRWERFNRVKVRVHTGDLPSKKQ